MRISYLLLLVAITTSNAFATGFITPRLEKALVEAATTHEPVKVLIVLKDQVNIQALDDDLYSQRASIEERAYTVITSLQSVADQTQGPLLSFLASKTRDEVLQYEAYWVVNLITIEALSEVILEISLRDDVAYLDLDAELSLDKPVSQGPAAESSPGSAEPGLRVINANRMWDLGYTGAGRLVMNIDTGVNGSHPAVSYKWRGTHVPASEAWFDPVNGTTFPNDCDGHGTHTIGIMSGLDPATDDTVGVAPGAEWIASNSLCSSPHTSNSIASFQWAMDPDGDPSTTDDMPDAIGNSWFDPSATDCSTSVYRPVFDAVEASGIAIVFSAGNAGPRAGTITIPKNINTNEVNVFATGAIDGNNPAFPIASFSSRGPSTCGGFGSLLIKPESCAPGVSVRSSYGSGYTLLSGTSMACPHVVGAIALLKEAYPQFTGHELKMALYNTSVDLGPSGEDNTYGMGLIDVYEAFLSLGAPNPPSDFNAYSDYTTPTSIQLTWQDPTHFTNGDTLLVGNYTLYLKRDDVVIDSLEGGIEQYLDENLVEGQEYMYEMYTELDTASLASIAVSVSWTSGGSRQPSSPLNFSITGNQDQITLGWVNPSTNSDGTPMVDFAGINLYQDGALVATHARASSDTTATDSASFSPSVPGAYSWYITAIDNEVPQHESEPTATLVTPLNIPLTDNFVDAGSPNPAIWVTENADVNTRSNNPPSAPYALNLNSTPVGGDTVEMQPLDLSNYQGSGIVLSYYYQPQGNGNAPEVMDSLRLFFKNDLSDWVRIRGYAGRMLQAFQQQVIDIAAEPNGGGSYFHGQFQIRFVSNGSLSPTPTDDWFVDNVYLGLPAPAIAASEDTVRFDTTLVGNSSIASLSITNSGLDDLTVSDVISTNATVFSVDTTSFTLSPGSSLAVNVTFTPNQSGLLTGSLQFVSNDPVTDTLTIYLEGVGSTVSSSPVSEFLPREFFVSPNYPNPFNPVTTIKYDLPIASNVELVLYSLLGGRVRTLLTGVQPAGFHEVQWDGKNDAGIPVTSGMYIYQFIAGDYRMVRKMILLK